MAYKLYSGNQYIIEVEKHFYLTRQVGQKSWRAMEFANLEVEIERRVIEGNGSSIVSKIADRFSDRPQVYRMMGESQMRRAMFNILKFGRVEQ